MRHEDSGWNRLPRGGEKSLTVGGWQSAGQAQSSGAELILDLAVSGSLD